MLGMLGVQKWILVFTFKAVVAGGGVQMNTISIPDFSSAYSCEQAAVIMREAYQKAEGIHHACIPIGYM